MSKEVVKSKESLAYDNDSVDLLEGLEAIRKRYDMYVGSIDSAALHLVNEVIDNSIDEALNGFADKVVVNYVPKENKVSIEDNGRGLPTGINTKTGLPTIELLLSKLHAGSKFNKNSFKVSGGKNGINKPVPFSGDTNR